MSEKRKNVTFYGFDKVGFDLPNRILKIENIFIHFVGFNEQLNLENADGVVIPQGIFEKFTSRRDVFGDVYTEVQSFQELLLEREKQIFNFLIEGKWVCFLIREMVDFVPQNYNRQDVSDIDLSKKILNAFDIKRNKIEANTTLEPKQNEFINYTKRYGVAKTVFSSRGNFENKILIKAGEEVAGLELINKLFILPFHTVDTAVTNLETLATILPKSIEDYRQKHSEDLPNWLDDFQFNQEKKDRAEVDAYFTKITELEKTLGGWKAQKGILTTSGEVLKKKVVMILETFFEFKVDPLDEGLEDAKLLSDDGKQVLALIEVKGTKKGVRRENINQVDSHRERNDLDATIPGVLIINNEMDISGVEERDKTKIEEEHIKHAKRSGILIVRTIDLLFLMRNLENSPNKKSILLGYFKSGGGWLKVDSTGQAKII